MSMAPPKIYTTGSGVVTRVNRHVWEPALMPGQKIRVQLGSQYAIYEVPRDQVPYPVFDTWLNLASFTNPLATMGTDGSQTSLNDAGNASIYDVLAPGIGQYKVVGTTAGVEYEINQPAGVGRFRNKAGNTRFTSGSTLTHYENGNYGALPELWMFGNQSTPKILAYNLDMNKTKPMVNVMLFGYFYPLELRQDIKEDAMGQLYFIGADSKPHLITAVMTVDVGQPSGR